MMNPATRIVRAAVTAAAAAVLAGCTVTHNPDELSRTSSATTPASIVKDGRVTLDFRHPPTRDEFGLPSNQNWRFYIAKDRHVYDLTIELPDGTLRLPVTDIDGDTDDAGGASDSDYRHLPRFFTIKARYPTDAAADQAVAHQLARLGINRRATVSDVLLSGSPSHRLSVTVQRVSNLSASLDPGERYYFFTFDEYHNPAIDKVLINGRMKIDLRRPPSREQLGFTPTYDTADVKPPPPSTEPYTVDLELPGGRAVVRSDSVTSVSGPTPDQPDSTAPPSRTDLTSIRSIAGARAELTKNAAALGLTTAQVNGLFAGSGPVTRTLRVRASAYDLELRLDANLSTTDESAASVRYVFTYKRS